MLDDKCAPTLPSFELHKLWWPLRKAQLASGWPLGARLAWVLLLAAMILTAETLERGWRIEADSLDSVGCRTDLLHRML